MTLNLSDETHAPSNPKAILVTLPVTMAEAVDGAAAELRQTRLAFIRECIRRGLAYYEANERPHVLRLREEAEMAMRKPLATDAHR